MKHPNHTKKCTNFYSWFFPILLRFFSRCGLIIPLSYIFWRQFITGQSDTNKFLDDFAMELEKDSNFKLVNAYVKKYWPWSVRKNSELKELLNTIKRKNESNLNARCFTSFFQSVFLMAVMMFFGVQQGSSFWMTLLGWCDLVSFGFTLALYGIIVSLYFTEMHIKHGIREIKIMHDASKKIGRVSKAAEDYITNRWYKLEIVFRFLSVIIPIILLLSWASGTPLSCGVSAELVPTANSSKYWGLFVCIILIGQIAVFNSIDVTMVPYVAIAAEIAAMIMLWFTCDSFHWSSYTHILYAIVPLTYLLWYHFASAKRQWICIDSKRADGNPTHISRFASCSGLSVLIILSLLLSTYTEYRHVDSLSKANSLAIQHPFDQKEYERLQELVNKYCNTLQTTGVNSEPKYCHFLDFSSLTNEKAKSVMHILNVIQTEIHIL